MNPLGLLTFALSFSMCATNQYSVVLEVDEPQEDWRYQISLVASCEIQPLYAQPNGPELSVSIDVDSTSPLGDAPPGNYGLFAQAINANCEVVAAGCADVRIEANGIGELRVPLQEMLAPACMPTQVCVAGRCGGFSADASTDVPQLIDGGVQSDANPPESADAGSPDVGEYMDAGVDAIDGAGDAGEMDAGEADAGEVDAGPDAGPEDAGPPPTFCETHGGSAYVCADFQTGLSEDWHENDREGISTIEIDRSFGVGGTSDNPGASLRRTAAFGGRSAVSLEVDPVEGEFWLRFSVFLTRDSAQELAYFELASVNGKDLAPYHFLGATLTRDNQPRLSHNRQHRTDPLHIMSPNANVGGEWVCFEAHVSEEGDVEFFQDGQSLGSRDVGAHGPWDTISLGGTTSLDQPEADVWLDDIMWSPARVPCGSL